MLKGDALTFEAAAGGRSSDVIVSHRCLCRCCARVAWRVTRVFVLIRDARPACGAARCVPDQCTAGCCCAVFAAPQRSAFTERRARVRLFAADNVTGHCIREGEKKWSFTVDLGALLALQPVPHARGHLSRSCCARIDQTGISDLPFPTSAAACASTASMRLIPVYCSRAVSFTSDGGRAYCAGRIIVRHGGFTCWA